MNHWVSCSLADLSWTQLQVGFRSFILFGQWLFRHTILRAKVKSTRRQAQWQKDIQSPFFKPWSKQIINQSQNQSAGKHPPPIIRPNQVIWPSPTSIGWESVFLPWGKGEEEESEYLLNHNLINHRNVTCILQIRKLRSLVQSAELGVESNSIFFQSSHFFSLIQYPLGNRKENGMKHFHRGNRQQQIKETCL